MGVSLPRVQTEPEVNFRSGMVAYKVNKKMQVGRSRRIFAWDVEGKEELKMFILNKRKCALIAGIHESASPS